MNKSDIIQSLFDQFTDIRYVAIYHDDDLLFKQREDTEDSSSGDTDKFEELLVNPTLLKLAGQRGNIDCGGLDHLLIGYGNFYQLVRSIDGGHISICLDKASDLNALPSRIFSFLEEHHTALVLK